MEMLIIGKIKQRISSFYRKVESPFLKISCKTHVELCEVRFSFQEVEVLSLTPSQISCIQIKLLKSSILEKGSGSLASSDTNFSVVFAKSPIFHSPVPSPQQTRGWQPGEVCCLGSFYPRDLTNTATVTTRQHSLEASQQEGWQHCPTLVWLRAVESSP